VKRFVLSLLLLFASVSLTSAQVMREVPDSEPMPSAVSASIEASMDPEEILNGIRRWEGNLVGDATPDYLVEASFSPVGGNAFYPRHYIFIASPDRFEAFFPIELPGSIISAGIEGNALVVTVSTYLPSDARCCPSGVEVVRLPLN
jgi:hypothetical protein